MNRMEKIFSGSHSVNFVNSVKKILEKRAINFAALGMILDGHGKRIVAQSHLLDDVIGGAPRFHFETFTRAIDRLMMRAVHLVEAMRRLSVVTQRLNIVIFHLWKFMAGNIE